MKGENFFLYVKFNHSNNFISYKKGDSITYNIYYHKPNKKD